MNFELKLIGNGSPCAVYFADIYIGQIIINDDAKPDEYGVKLRFVADYPGGKSYQYVEEAAADILRANASGLRQDIINQLDSALETASRPF